MRTLGGVLLGLLLFYPGIVLLRWVSVNVLGAYDALTLTDGCLVMIMILLCVNLVRGTSAVGVRSHARQERRRSTPAADFPTDPQLEFLPGDKARPERRRTAGRRPSTRRRER